MGQVPRHASAVAELGVVRRRYALRMNEAIIAHAESAAAILRCYPVMSQLRPHIREDEFVERVSRLQKQGYRLAYLEADSQIRALAGYRFMERLAWGPFCYVDDLVTDSNSRSQAFGQIGRAHV